MSFIFKFSNLRNQHDKTINVLHDFTNQVIKQRRHELITKSDINQNILESDADDIGIKKKYALLDVLLNSNVHGRPLTDLEIREEVDTFMFEVNFYDDNDLLYYYLNDYQIFFRFFFVNLGSRYNHICYNVYLI